MKSMNDRKMDMKKGKMDQDYFPEDAHSKMLMCPVGNKRFDYPDTEEQIYGDQMSQNRSVDKREPKTGFRH